MMVFLAIRVTFICTHKKEYMSCISLGLHVVVTQEILVEH